MSEDVQSDANTDEPKPPTVYQTLRDHGFHTVILTAKDLDLVVDCMKRAAREDRWEYDSHEKMATLSILESVLERANGGGT